MTELLQRVAAAIDGASVERNGIRFGWRDNGVRVSRIEVAYADCPWLREDASR